MAERCTGRAAGEFGVRRSLDSTTCWPLCWGEARARLRDVLTDYLNEPRPTKFRKGFGDGGSLTQARSILSFCIRWDVDLYSGVAFSVALLILASISLEAKRNGTSSSSMLKPQADQEIYRAQVVASALLVVFSLVSLWMVFRHRFLFLNDRDTSKRREISKFLNAMEKTCSEAEETVQDHSRRSFVSGFLSDELVQVAGTALTNIYPVYRRPEADDVTSAASCENSSAAGWSRVPGLLLVEGDLIALQVGDIAPAPCRVAHHNEPSALYHSKTTLGTLICEGNRVSLDSFAETTPDIMAHLPRGRVTLQTQDSEHLLTLCNRMRIFCVMETPISKFLRRPPVPSKPPQIWRQLHEIRKVLLLMAIVSFIFTAIVVFCRPGSTSDDLSLILSPPLLAAIAILPIVGPFFIFLLEVIGSARILVSAHPYASEGGGEWNQQSERCQRTRLLLRYVFATTLSRLSLWTVAESIARGLRAVSCRKGGSDYSKQSANKLVRVPPASINLLEKLGVATAFTLVDDELACEPQAIPQQLLIPSGKGLKLLDLCPAYDDETDAESASDIRTEGRNFDSDESEEGTTESFHDSLSRKVLKRKLLRKRKSKGPSVGEISDQDTDATAFDVQFEDPTWWQHLPSLKCIGLACLLVDEERSVDAGIGNHSPSRQLKLDDAKSALVRLICAERSSNQLRSLAQCIGFSTDFNSFGTRGDLSPFSERLRIHVLSDSLYKGRLEIDAHERSSEQSRWWGLIRPDSTSVIVQDSRSQAYQLLTVGDPAVVTSLCNEAWQGEISTILPLSPIDRRTILETTNSWKLADLDVAAFSYSPVPHTLEQRLVADDNLKAQMYLLDHCSRGDQAVPLLKDKSVSPEWSLIRNQVFLGVLGSLVVPRREIQKLLNILSDAGVRFVYFSPRNMRRQKELASQMGIDVAWNCAISLRPLESGEEEDPHRMVSSYGDWDKNARLPHGVDDVRKHLKEVDNVPLLVSLYTDVTKKTTKEVVEIFQEYKDTVISIGLSHLPWNDDIFSTADIAVGIDVLTETLNSVPTSHRSRTDSRPADKVSPAEIEFTSAIAAHSCAFRFRGTKSLSHLSDIIEQGRVSLDAAVAAAVFQVTGCLSFSFFVFFSVCAVSTAIPFVPTLGAVVYLQFLLPGMGLTMALSDGERDTMKRVPQKNDQTVAFGRKEGWRLYTMIGLKAFPPAVLPQLLYLIAFGELVIFFDPELVRSGCSGATSWVGTVRCDALREYSGKARISAAVLMWAEFVLCIAITSAGFVRRFATVWEQPPWDYNVAWVLSVIFTLLVTVVYVAVTVEAGTGSALPWYYYLLAVIAPFLCLIWNEAFKREDAKQERRAEKLRRLQFETRLGAWSPK